MVLLPEMYWGATGEPPCDIPRPFSVLSSYLFPFLTAQAFKNCGSFRQNEMEEKFQKGNKMVQCPRHGDVDLEEFGKDLTFSEVENLDWESLAVKKKIGEGSFATVYIGENKGVPGTPSFDSPSRCKEVPLWR